MTFNAAARWRPHSIGDVADVIGGGTPSTKVAENFGGDIPWITPKDLAGHESREIAYGQRNITEAGLTSSSARLLPKGAVLLSTRAPIGYVAVAAQPVSTNQGFRSLVLKNGHVPEFFYYLLKANITLLESRSSGSTFREISGSAVKQIELPIPPPDEQARIAWVLDALDDKIESNRRIAKTFGEIAAALFKARFVDFIDRDDLVESEIGLIPSGWNVASLSEISDVLARGRGPAYISDGGVLVLNQKCIRDGRVSFQKARRNDDGRRDSTDRRVEPGDVLINSTGVGTLGRVAQVRWLPEATTIDSHVTMVRADGHSADQDYLAMALLARQGDLERLGHGTTGQTELTRSRLAEFSIPIPPMDEQRAFSESHGPTRNALAALERETLTLTAIRDSILPRLISGQIRVPTASSEELSA